MENKSDMFHQTEVTPGNDINFEDRLAFLNIDQYEEVPDHEENAIKDEESKHESDDNDDGFFDMIKKKNRTLAVDSKKKQIMDKIGNYMKNELYLDINPNLEEDNNSQIDFEFDHIGMGDFGIDLTS
jgi:hypothetical protein